MKEQLNGSRRLFLRPGGENIAFSHYAMFEGFDLFEKYAQELEAVEGPDPKAEIIQSILHKERWGEELEKFVIERLGSDRHTYSEVLCYATAQQWTNLVLSSRAKDINGFRTILLDEKAIGEKEAEILREIQQNVQNKLDQDPPKDKIIVMQLRWLVGNIKDKLDPPKKS